jgi:hypothetical protein
MCAVSDYAEAYRAYVEVRKFYEEGIRVTDGNKPAVSCSPEEFLRHILDKERKG